MIKEVIVVEGKSDIARLKKSGIEADIIATEGFCLRTETVKQIENAYKKRGIIILTDPDGAGERIRKYLAERFPEAKHAFVPREDAYANDDIGIEQASPEAIRAALAKVRTTKFEPGSNFSMADLFANDLNGSPDSQVKRAQVGAILGIGYGNAKQFLSRLNHFDISRTEWQNAIKEINEVTNNE
jgi:ribonuclease M5